MEQINVTVTLLCKTNVSTRVLACEIINLNEGHLLAIRIAFSVLYDY